MWPNPRFPVDMVAFTEEIVDEKRHFLCGGNDVLPDKSLCNFNIKF